MRSLTECNLYVQRIDDDHYFLSAKNMHNQSLPSSWKNMLLLWHEETHFGSTANLTTYQDTDGIILNSWSLLTLLAKENFPSFIQWNWDDFGSILLASGAVIYEEIMDGEWNPSFYTEDGRLHTHWDLPQDIIDEFHPPFWEQQFNGDSALNIIKKWYQQSIKQYIENHPTSAEKLDTLRHTPLEAESLTQFFQTNDFREWLGLTEKAKPYALGLRLMEPDMDDQPWTVETFLREKNNPDNLVFFSKQNRLPTKWRKYQKQINTEQKSWLELFPWLAEENGTSISEKLPENLAFDFLTIASERLLSLGVEILLPSWWKSIREAQLSMKAQLKQSTSQYRPSFIGMNAMRDFDWRISMDNHELTEEEFRSLIHSNRNLLKINGEWVRLDPKMIRQLQDLMTRAQKEGIRMQDLLLQEMDNDTDEDANGIDNEAWDPRTFANIKIELNQSLKKFIHQLQHLKELPIVSAPESFHGNLREYQTIGVNWMNFLREHHFGAVLADDMGLGKTLQLIVYLLHVKETKQATTPALIICPTSVLGNWQKEFEKFAPSMKVNLHYGPNRHKGEAFEQLVAESDVILTSYGLSHLDFDEFSNLHWSTVALDEAQNIKNAQTKQSQAIRQLKGDHHIALTGTPMENHLSELWAIFDFTNRGYLGTYNQFQKNYIVTIDKDKDKKKIQQLQSLIRPFLLRRTKKDPEVELNLPEKLEQKEYCALTAEQASLYEQLVQDTFSQLANLSGFQRKGLILQMINRLKQLCNHPALYLKEPEPTSITTRSLKMQKLSELLTSILSANEACLIFTQYIGMGEMMQTLIEEQFGIKVPFLNGSMSKAKRDEYVARFQNGEFPIFILSLKAGGTGLNLTTANHVIHYDRWWNPAVENQATDRAYRIGQKRFVHVHKMISTGTLEEKIDKMLEQKQSLNDEIIQSEQWITELNNDDLKDLISLSNH